MAALLDLPPNEEPPAFRAAVLHACREARRLPTLASTVAWRTSYLIRHGAPPNEVLQEHFQGGMLLAALHGQGGDGGGEGGGQPQAQAYLEQFQQLQAMVLEAADAQVLSSLRSWLSFFIFSYAFLRRGQCRARRAALPLRRKALAGDLASCGCSVAWARPGWWQQVQGSINFKFLKENTVV